RPPRQPSLRGRYRLFELSLGHLGAPFDPELARLLLQLLLRRAGAVAGRAVAPRPAAPRLLEADAERLEQVGRLFFLGLARAVDILPLPLRPHDLFQRFGV